MPLPPATVQSISEALRAGDRPRALALARAALVAHPDDAAALFYAGITELESGDRARAVEHLRRAAVRDAANATVHGALGRALRLAGQDDEALSALTRALALKPDLDDALVELAKVHRSANRPAEAEAGFRRALELKPARLDALLGLGTLYLDTRNFELARSTLARARDLKPASDQILLPLGKALAALNRDDEALACFREAAAQKPKKSGPHVAIAAVQFAQGALAEAAASYRRALALKPDDIAAEAGLGVIADAEDRRDDAIKHFERVVALNPEAAEARSNLALVHLRHRDFARGWEQYAWRWKTKRLGTFKRRFALPAWDGVPRPDQPVLVWAEQGVGDEIFYSGWAAELAAQGQPVIFECEPRLLALFQRAYPALTLMARPALAPAAATHQIALSDLGRILRPTADAITAPQARLAPDPALVQRLRGERDALWDDARGPVVGLCWRAPHADSSRHKTFRLETWRAILATPGVRWLDLQYGDTDAERRAVKDALGVDVKKLASVDLFKDLDGAAALASICDLVIAVSNTTAHIAAAVGTPTWILVPRGGGRMWYWFTASGPSPWYANVTLFQQPAPARWGDTIPEIARRLARFGVGS